jgi:protein archease
MEANRKPANEGRALNVKAPHWEHFSHGSDIGVRGFGASVEEAFEQAAVALTAVVADVSRIRQLESIEVRCTAPDVELLLVSWLNAVIYEMAVRKMLFSGFQVATSGCSLTGNLLGEKVDPERHQLAVEAKGATYTGLRVAQQDGQWLAECVVDV